MAEEIYYYDETAPLTRSHDEVLHYQRHVQEPASYLVELPGTLPLPPPELQTRETRRGTSIVAMERTASEEQEQDEPLVRYLRANLPSFRKSLTPEDLEGVRKTIGGTSGSVLIEGKVESRLTPQNKNAAGEKMQKTSASDTSKDKEIQNTPVKNNSDDNKTSKVPLYNEYAVQEIQRAPQNENLANKKVQKTTQNEKQVVKKILKYIPNENQNAVGEKMQKTYASDTLIDKDLQNTPAKNNSNENKTSKVPLFDESADQEILRAPQNKILVKKKVRKTTPNEKQEVKKIQNSIPTESNVHKKVRKMSQNEKPTVKEMPKASLIETPINKDIVKKQKTSLLELRSSNNKSSQVNNVENKNLFQSNNYITAMPMLIERGGPMAAKEIKDFNEKSRVKVRLMVDLLDDGQLEVSKVIENNVRDGLNKGKERNPCHNDYFTTCPNKNTKQRARGGYVGEWVKPRPHHRSWSANSGRESIDRDHSPFFNSYYDNVTETSGLNSIDNRSIRGPIDHKHNHRSRSASTTRYSNDNSLTQSTAKEINNLRRNSNLKKPDGSNERRHNVSNSYDNDSQNITTCKTNFIEGMGGNHAAGNKLEGKKLYINCGTIHSGREYGGYDGKNKNRDDSPIRNKTGKPFSYDGMINCEIEDCPCRCHPDYDHGDKQKTSRDLDSRGRDNPDRYRGKGYDPFYDGDINGKGRPKDDRGRDYPDRYNGKGYDPFYDGDIDGKGRPKDDRSRDYPDRYGGKGYDPFYDGDIDGKGRPKDARSRDYPDRYGGKGYDPFYDGDLDGKARPRDGKDRDYPGYDRDMDGKGWPSGARDKYKPDEYSKGSPDSRARRGDGDDYPYGGPPGKTVGFRPGDRSPGDGKNVRVDDDDASKSVLKQRAPKSATTFFTHKRYHVQIQDHNLKEPWFNARFSIDNKKNVDLNYQGPVKITNYYTSSRYE